MRFIEALFEERREGKPRIYPAARGTRKMGKLGRRSSGDCY